MDYVQISVEKLSVEKKEILIALLSNAGFDGFEEEEKGLKAFIQAPRFNQNIFDQLVKTTDITYSKSIIKEINWNEKWESDFEPVRVNVHSNKEPFAIIRANFHPPDNSFLHDIIITPKMSFGTGHHATTYLMVSLMSGIDFKDKTVIDFGTGTGILAILAEKMGAASVMAIDCDDWSINNAKENLLVNSCSKIRLIKGDMIPENAPVDVILANINLNVIIANLMLIKKAAKHNATILFSGIMLHDEVKLVNDIVSVGMKVTDVYRKEKWVAISVVNN